MTVEIVAIGASLGGLNALRTVLGELPTAFPVPITLVQHRSDDGGGRLVALLQERSGLEVIEADDKQPLTPGRVYLAPSDYHLLVDEGFVGLSVDERVCHARPSIDVLFESAARAHGPGVVAVVLTGSTRDGLAGARCVHLAGGTVLVQDPDEAASDILPRAIVENVPARILPLAEIPYQLCRICGMPPISR